MTTFEAKGLASDNLLAFLVVLGGLHALEVAEPAWSPRVRWTGTPHRPEFIVASALTDDDFLEALSRGARTIAATADFGGADDVKFSEPDARKRLRSIVESVDGERWHAALYSDGALKSDKNNRAVVAPPLVTMLGQGHQHFLKRLIEVGSGALPKDLQRGKKRIDLNSPEYLRRALFEEWRREDKTDAFRWDPQEDRRYALRDVNPSSDAGTTEHGANRLAICAIPLLTSMPTGRAGSQAIATVGFSLGSDRKRRFTWPIWTQPLDLRTVIALMTQRGLHRDEVDLTRLRPYGVIGAMRSMRIENGYYANFAWAEALG